MIFCVRCVFIVNAAQYLELRYWEWLTTTKSPTEQSKEIFGKTRKVVTSKKMEVKVTLIVAIICSIPQHYFPFIWALAFELWTICVWGDMLTFARQSCWMSICLKA